MATAVYIPGPITTTGAPVLPENGTYRIIENGGSTYFQIKNSTTGKWHTLFISGNDPAATLNLGPGED